MRPSTPLSSALTSSSAISTLAKSSTVMPAWTFIPMQTHTAATPNTRRACHPRHDAVSLAKPSRPITEHYTMVGGHKWTIPVFLFRYHADARKYVFALARDPKRQRELHGRHGNDFIALCLNDDGSVGRFLAGEAKWRKSLTPGGVDTLMFGEWVKESRSEGPHRKGNLVRTEQRTRCTGWPSPASSNSQRAES